MNRQYDISTILQALPHRYPFLLIDKVIDFEAGKFLIGIKNVTINEPCFTGHFPENPIMPGVLILEALAQAGALFAHFTREPKEGNSYLFYFAGIDNAKFKQIVIPGDQLTLKVETISERAAFWKVHGEAFVDDKLVCSADLLSAIKEVKRDK